MWQTFNNKKNVRFPEHQHTCPRTCPFLKFPNPTFANTWFLIKLLLVNLCFFMCHTYWSRPDNFLFYKLEAMLLKIIARKLPRLVVDSWRDFLLHKNQTSSGFFAQVFLRTCQHQNVSLSGFQWHLLDEQWVNMFWNVTKCCEMLWNVVKCCEMFGNVANCCEMRRMLWNVWQCYEQFAKCLDMLWNVFGNV